MPTTTSTVDPDTITQAGDSPKTIRDKILLALYHTGPGVAFEDVLELSGLIDPPPKGDSHTNQARAVLIAVHDEVKTWPDPPTIYAPLPAHE